MIDFTGYREVNGEFGGSERKTAILYKEELYMIKYPDPVREKSNALSYMNNQFSEYIGCKIFEALSIPVQETFLARFTPDFDNKERIVVACKNFVNRADGESLTSAANINLSNFHSARALSTSIEDVNYVINKINSIDKEAVRERFWDTFVVDALIGNTDRHMNNWGFIVKNYDIVAMAPVFDCGSSLSALLSDQQMEKNLNDESLFKDKEYNISSVYSVGGRRLFYHTAFKEPNEDLKQAVLRIVPKIDLEQINKIIEDTEYLSDTRKRYLKQAVLCRYENMLVPCLTKIMKEKYSSLENITSTISEELKKGRPLQDIELEALKYMPSKGAVPRKIRLREAIKILQRDPTFRKILSNEMEQSR